jgi:osomolarity two-component system sensor histidine kinase SLN1
MDSGMDFFLSKPIRRPALKHVLKTYCPPIIEEEEGEKTPPANKSSKSNVPRLGQAPTSISGSAPYLMTPKAHTDESPAISPSTAL